MLSLLCINTVKRHREVMVANQIKLIAAGQCANLRNTQYEIEKCTTMFCYNWSPHDQRWSIFVPCFLFRLSLWSLNGRRECNPHHVAAVIETATSPVDWSYVFGWRGVGCWVDQGHVQCIWRKYLPISDIAFFVVRQGNIYWYQLWQG